MTLGGSRYKHGELIACKGLKSRLIYIVYEGSVRSCSILSDFSTNMKTAPVQSSFRHQNSITVKKMNEAEESSIETREYSFEENLTVVKEANSQSISNHEGNVPSDEQHLAR